MDAPRRYDDADTDSSFLDGCPTRNSIDQLGRSFGLELALHRDTVEAGWQYLGEVADAMSAVGLVTEFAALADCTPEFDSIPVIVGGRTLDVPGASAAGVLELAIGVPGTPERAEFRLVVLAAGPRVTALAFVSSELGRIEPEEIDRVVEIAASKLAG